MDNHEEGRRVNGALSLVAELCVDDHDVLCLELAVGGGEDDEQLGFCLLVSRQTKRPASVVRSEPRDVILALETYLKDFIYRSANNQKKANF